jgi:hypothetical protein
MPFEQPKSNSNRDGFCQDTLFKLVSKGPLEAGDVPSKSGLGDLIQHRLAIPILVNGQDGYYAATHLGRDFFINHYPNSPNGDQRTSLAEAIAQCIAIRVINRQIRNTAPDTPRKGGDNPTP